MRRALAALLLVALVGCAGDDEDPVPESVGTTTTTERSTTTSTPAVERDPSCTPGEVLPGGEVTYLAEDGRVLGVAPDGSGERCLADAQPEGDVVWSGTGANAILPSGEVVVDGRFVAPVPTPAAWSAPTGTSVLWREDDRILKRKREEQRPIDVGFVSEVEGVLYHPAGRAIVAVGDGPFGYGIYLGSNDGQYLRELVVGEHADGITDLTWTRSGALMFVGIHGDESHVHRLDLGAGQLDTLAVEPGITGLLASPHATGGVAWRAGDDGLVITRDGVDLAVDNEVHESTPVGWLPDGSLVVHHDDGHVAVVGEGAPITVADDAVSVSVRAPLPPPPELPADIPLQAPA